MADEKTPKISKKYVCEVCAFTSSNKKDYNKHLLTDKHKTNMNADKCLQITPENTPENCDKFVCMCGKSYKHRQSLFTHKKNCKAINGNNLNYDIQEEDSSSFNESASFSFGMLSFGSIISISCLYNRCLQYLNHYDRNQFYVKLLISMS